LPTYQVSLKVTGLTPSALKELLTKEEIIQLKVGNWIVKKKLNNKTFYMISHKDLMHILLDDDEDDRTF
jgi:hypothetical protein